MRQLKAVFAGKIFLIYRDFLTVISHVGASSRIASLFQVTKNENDFQDEEEANTNMQPNPYANYLPPPPQPPPAPAPAAPAADDAGGDAGGDNGGDSVGDDDEKSISQFNSISAILKLKI